VSELSHIITNTVDANTGLVPASLLSLNRERMNTVELEERLKQKDCGQPAEAPTIPSAASKFTSKTKEQLIEVIYAADRDDRWTAPLLGSSPSHSLLPEYSSIGAISRHLCLNLEQHLMFCHFARTIMFTVGEASGIDADDLPTSLRPSREQKIGFLNGGAGINYANYRIWKISSCRGLAVCRK